MKNIILPLGVVSDRSDTVGWYISCITAVAAIAAAVAIMAAGGSLLQEGLLVTLVSVAAGVAGGVAAMWWEKRSLHRKPLTVVIVDGEIGAGKTTLIRLVATALRAKGVKVCAAEEPVELWKDIGILPAFYEDPARRAYEFQTFTFVTRVLSINQALEANPDTEVIILERTIWTDRCVFMELQRELVGEMGMAMYDVWWTQWARIMPVPLHGPNVYHLYLKPEIGSCMDRVHARARVGETRQRADEMEAESRADETGGGGKTKTEAIAKGGVSEEYQRLLRAAHEAMLENKDEGGKFSKMPPRPFDPFSVLVLNGDLAESDFATADSGASRKIAERVLGFIGR